MKLDLLSVNNPKTMKGENYGYLTAILHLAPSTLSGYNTCPMASKGCAFACLNTAGHGGMFRKGETTNVVQEARIRKTRMFYENRVEFMQLLVKDIRRVEKYAAKLNLLPAIRLNGTSDIVWESVPVMVDGIQYANIMLAFPHIMYYDYTKRTNRVNLPTNYHLTFSLSESNMEDAMKMLVGGINVAVVFRDTLPETYLGYPVYNADLHDLRFLDPKNGIAGLKAKGRAKKDTSGFVKETPTD